MEEEVFEIIDYTSASGWEKLITNIEQTLLQWGIDGESKGIFDEIKIRKQFETNFIRKETLAFNEQSFSFYYHHCPPSSSLDNLNFLPAEGSYDCPLHKNNNSVNTQYTSQSTATSTPTNGNNSATCSSQENTLTKSNSNIKSFIPNLPLHIKNNHPFHSLHRWTGHSHFLILKPAEATNKPTFFLNKASTASVNQETFDMSTGKLLLSACIVAFHVARCSIPVYLPVGQSGRSMYIGFHFEPGLDTYALQVQETDEDLGCFEYRTRSVSLASIPSAYSNLQSLIKLFEERTASDCLQPNALEKGVHVSIAKSFRISNQDKKPKFSFLTNKMNTFQVGSKRDPLRSLLLTCYFDTMKIESYQDRALYLPLDPFSSNRWTISVELDEDVLFESPRRSDSELPGMTKVLSEYINTWVDCFEQEQEANEDKDMALSSLALTESSQEKSLTGRIRQGLLMKPMFVKENNTSTTSLIRQRPNSLDVSQLEPCIVSLFGKVGPTMNSLTTTSSNSKSDPLSIQSLMGRIKSHISVPVDSFFWQLAFRLVDLNFSLNNISTSSLLQSMWTEVAARIRKCWERGVFINLVNTDCKSWKDVNDQTNLKVELKFPLLHQKLMMINYCIYRKVKAGKYAHINEEISDNALSTAHGVIFEHPEIPQPVEDLYQESMVELSKKVISSLNIGNILSSDTSTVLQASSSYTNTSTTTTVVTAAARGATDRILNNNNLAATTGNTAVPINQSNIKKQQEVMIGTSWKSEKSWENFSKSDLQGIGIMDLRSPISASSHSRELSAENHDGIFVDSMEMGVGAIACSPPTIIKKPVVGESDDLQPSSYSRDSSILSIDTVSVPNSFPKTSPMVPEKLNHNQMSSIKARRGHKKVIPGLKLTKTNEEMWEPETQEPGFMTEDAIREQQIIFERLGTSKEAQALRAKMQSVSLLSDMEAFKAANPGSVLEDFVKWHSPRDWISDEQGQGKMSQRMTEPGNLWQQLWMNAKPVPATEQTPLFDYEKEGEQAVLFLDIITQHQLMTVLLLPICLIVFDGLVKDETVQRISLLERKLKTAALQLEHISWDHLSVHDTFDLTSFMSSVHEIEVLITVVKALEAKLPGQYTLIECILMNRETKIESSQEKQLIFNLLRQSSSRNSSAANSSITGSVGIGVGNGGSGTSMNLPTPYLEEFILSGTQSGHDEIVPSTEKGTLIPTVRKKKHRMYVSLSEKNGMRLVETCCQDGEFH